MPPYSENQSLQDQTAPIKDIVVKCCENQASSRPAHQVPLYPMFAHTEKYNATHIAAATEAEIASAADQ